MRTYGKGVASVARGSLSCIVLGWLSGCVAPERTVSLSRTPAPPAHAVAPWSRLQVFPVVTNISPGTSPVSTMSSLSSSVASARSAVPPVRTASATRVVETPSHVGATPTGAVMRSPALSPVDLGASAESVDTEGRRKRMHLQFKSPEAFSRFRGIWDSSLQLQRDIETITRLLGETDAALRKIETRLLDDYGIQPDRHYRFDQKDATVFEIDPQRPDEKPRVHRRLATDEVQKDFSSLLAARERARLQVQAFNLALRDKRMEMEQIKNTLFRDYAMSRDRDYIVADSERTVFELIPAAVGENDMSSRMRTVSGSNPE